MVPPVPGIHPVSRYCRFPKMAQDFSLNSLNKGLCSKDRLCHFSEFPAYIVSLPAGKKKAGITTSPKNGAGFFLNSLNKGLCSKDRLCHFSEFPAYIVSLPAGKKKAGVARFFF